MTTQVTSADGTSIHFEATGSGSPALVFVHGWLGNVRWWDAQRDHFAARHQVVTIDLAGHGQSAATRTAWSVEHYADDIRAVLDHIEAAQVVLVGHSMSGPNVLAAAGGRADVLGVVLVDTMKNLDRIMPVEQARQMMELYRTDFRNAVENIMPQYLFSPATPADLRDRLQHEFLAVTPEFAVTAIQPLYQADLRAIAAGVGVPVRGINADYDPVDATANRKHFVNYDAATVAQSGHYPMLERPAEFNAALEAMLATIPTSRSAPR